MGPSITTHTTLLARLASGADQTAWRAFHDRYAELIHGFARRMGLQDADGDEITQDVLVSLSKSMRTFEYDPAKGKFRSYLKTVVAREIHRRLNQKRGAIALGDVEDLGAAAPNDSAADEGWEAEWRQYHLRLAMKTIEAEFSRSDLAAFRTYALAGQDAHEVAEALGLSVDQIYQAKSRILRRLAEVIDEQVCDEG